MQVASVSSPLRCHQFSEEKISTSLKPAKPAASTHVRIFLNVEDTRHRTCRHLT